MPGKNLLFLQREENQPGSIKKAMPVEDPAMRGDLALSTPYIA